MMRIGHAASSSGRAPSSQSLNLRRRGPFFLTMARTRWFCVARSASTFAVGWKSNSSVNRFQRSGFGSHSCALRRSWVWARSASWMPERTMKNLYPASAAFAITAVKLVVFPLWARCRPSARSSRPTRSRPWPSSSRNRRGSDLAQVTPGPLTAVASPLAAGGHVHGGEVVDHWTEWHFDPWVLLLLAALTVAYAVGWRRLRRRGGREYATIPRAIAFLAGINTLVLALVSPLHHLGMDYLLSAHMSQHMMVGDIAPILLCLGVYGPMRFFTVPGPVLRWAGGPRMRPVIRQLGRPRTAFLAWMLATGVWYVPGIYEASLENGALHYFMWFT